MAGPSYYGKPKQTFGKQGISLEPFMIQSPLMSVGNVSYTLGTCKDSVLLVHWS